MLDLLASPFVAWPVGIALGVIFDEAFTTGFMWVKKEGREEISKIVKKIKK